MGYKEKWKMMDTWMNVCMTHDEWRQTIVYELMKYEYLQSDQGLQKKQNNKPTFPRFPLKNPRKNLLNYQYQFLIPFPHSLFRKCKRSIKNCKLSIPRFRYSQSCTFSFSQSGYFTTYSKERVSRKKKRKEKQRKY